MNLPWTYYIKPRVHATTWYGNWGNSVARAYAKWPHR